MTTFVQTRWRLTFLIFSIGIFSLLTMTTSHADQMEKLRARLPGGIDGWDADGSDRLFDDKSIFEYINGAGEVYRAYNLQRCLARRYTSPGKPAIMLDLFDMGSSHDAFGVFTHDTDGKVVSIGQDGRYRPGWLSFWKNRFFVSIYMEDETPAAAKAVKNLGNQIASLIEPEGARPSILKNLPGNGLKVKTIRYLHHPLVLNYHYYISDENILNISATTDSVLADYLRNNHTARLLLVNYPDTASASHSHRNFLLHYLPNADAAGTTRLENGKWAAASRRDRLLVIVLEADSRVLAESLTQEVKGE